MTNQIIPVDYFLSNDEIKALQDLQKVQWSGLYISSNYLKYIESPEDPNDPVYFIPSPCIQSDDKREFIIYAFDSSVEELSEVTRLGAYVEEAGYSINDRKNKYVLLEHYPNNLQLGKFFGVYNKLSVVRTVSDEYYVFDGPQYEMHLDEHLLIENPQGERMLISVSIETATVDITTDDSIIEKILSEAEAVIPVDDIPTQTKEKPSLKKRLQKIFK